MRHGETPANREGKTHSHGADAELNEEGKMQIRKAVESFPEGITMIISSPARRAQQTAEIVAEKYGIEQILTRQEIGGVKFGSLSGKSVNEIMELIKNPDYDLTPYGGESAKQVMSRIVRFLKEINEQYPQEKIVMVTHKGIIRLMHYLFSEDKETEIPNASLHEFNIGSDHIILMGSENKSQ